MRKYLLVTSLLSCSALLSGNAATPTKKSVSEIETGYRIDFPESWKSCNDPVYGKEFLWTLTNFNYTVWGEHADVATWVDDKAKEATETLVCNIYKIKKTPGMGGNFYTELAAFFYERFPQFKLIKKGTISIAGTKSKWQIAQISENPNLQHYFLYRPSGNAVYCIYFWGNTSQIEGRFDEIQKIIASFTL